MKAQKAHFEVPLGSRPSTPSAGILLHSVLRSSTAPAEVLTFRVQIRRSPLHGLAGVFGFGQRCWADNRGT